ncbi:hypothetical protein RHSIM_Rhsim07G0084400 [Rhododendron simsii]|uniref:Protein kinase domain-containing protein n=1 Tax=Rhododendron simsii TaxID=118357 RepID=A0A834LK81_RHOSS|nr:hypothetical protein RHSIM_Rhsim07G0084400 [Rhododendron simsii]
MEQFRQVGEVLGGIKALMVLKHDISINQRQCSLLLHILDLAFKTISDQITQNLRLDDKNTKWKALEHPLRELHRIFKEGELYVKHCLDIKDWWGKAMSLHQNEDCVEFHIHNLLSCFTIVIEAIETAGEISGPDQDDMQKRRLMLMRKYDGEWNDPKIFQWKFGKQYLIPREICNHLSSAWREDRWFLLEMIKEKRSSQFLTMTKHEQRLADLLIKKLNGLEPLEGKLLPAWILLGAMDYHVKRRLGSGGSYYKEIHWLGESFAMRNFFVEINEQIQKEISLVQSLSHPNIMQHLCGFYEEERKELFLVMELMNKSLASHIKENCGQRKRIPFTLPVAVDIMLQIARGMEYLHFQKIYHGNLNPSNILLKVRTSSPEGYFWAKVRGFGLTSVKSYTSRTQSNQNADDQIIWYAPEVLAEQERQGGGKLSSKYTEKSDVYSFGMLCFEILTGKIPFEEGHLQEDKMGRNIRAGERPLFPYTTPKFLVNLTRKCWQTEPTQRPCFSAICRILRYIKKCLVINPDHGQPESPPPLVDYCEIDSAYSKLFPSDGSPCLVSQIPFQMFSYRVVEKERISGGFKDKIWDLGIEGPSLWGNEDPFLVPMDKRSVCSEIQERKPFLRVGGDVRSVCSETPWWRVPSKTANDQRSVSSGFLWSKRDQRSVGSLTPDRKFFATAIAADQRSIGSQTPERKDPTHEVSRSESSESSEREILSKTADDDISGHLENGERKNSPQIATDEKPLASDIPEKKPDSTAVAIQKSVGSKVTVTHTSFPSKAVDQSCHETRGKTLSRTVSSSGGYRTPERKGLPPIVSDSEFSSVHSESPEKRRSTKKTSDLRPVCAEIPGSKSLVKKNGIVAKGSKGPVTQEVKSPGSSPLRTLKEYSTRPSAKVQLPGSSPIRTPKGQSTRSSPIRTAKGHPPQPSSTGPSIQNPCARCSRLNRECRASSLMNPTRHPRTHASDSEVA